MTNPKPYFFIGALLMVTGVWCATALASPALIKEKQCGSCHRFSNDDAGRPAPDLFFAGDKFQRNWLESFLQKPETIRLAGPTRDPGFLKGTPQTSPHPILSPQDAKRMADHLMSLKVMEDSGPLNLPDLSKGMRVRVKILFERDYSCIACHQSYNLARQPRGGVSGPSLINAGRRLRLEWVYQWLKTPKLFTGNGRMPTYKLDDETLRKLTQYIMTHKKDPR